MTFDNSPAALAALYADIGQELARPDNSADAFAALSRVAVERVPGVEWASITRGRNGRFTTVAASDEAARLVDEIQYDLDAGPCVDAILRDVVFHTGDLAAEQRWPEFSERADKEFGVRSMLSYRLFLEDDVVAGLNLYSTRPAAFGDDAHIVGTLVATHGALAITAAAGRERATQLERALVNSRDIGVGMGVLMARHKLTRDQAFDLLRVASQTGNRKLATVARDVADTGVLELPGPKPGRRAAGPETPRGRTAGG